MQTTYEALQDLSGNLDSIGYICDLEQKSAAFPAPRLLCYLAERVVPASPDDDIDGEETRESILAQLYFNTDFIEAGFDVQVAENDRRLTVSILLSSIDIASSPYELALFSHFLNERNSLGQYHLSDADQSLYYRIQLPAKIADASLVDQLLTEALADINMHLPTLEALAQQAIDYEAAVKTILTATTFSFLEEKEGRK